MSAAKQLEIEHRYTGAVLYAGGGETLHFGRSRRGTMRDDNDLLKYLSEDEDPKLLPVLAGLLVVGVLCGLFVLTGLWFFDVLFPLPR